MARCCAFVRAIVLMPGAVVTFAFVSNIQLRVRAIYSHCAVCRRFIIISSSLSALFCCRSVHLSHSPRSTPPPPPVPFLLQLLMDYWLARTFDCCMMMSLTVCRLLTHCRSVCRYIGCVYRLSYDGKKCCCWWWWWWCWVLILSRIPSYDRCSKCMFFVAFYADFSAFDGILRSVS